METPVIYRKDFIADANVCFERLRSGLEWVQRDNTPRMEYYVNSFNTPYTYGSGDFARTYSPQAENNTIAEIRKSVEEATGTVFEVCFLNRYVNQSMHLGWHSDNSPEMDDNRPIAIVSLGVEREIWFRPMGSKDCVDKLVLNNGSLCLMGVGMQDTHQHRIPKSSRMCGERISLTFRGYSPIS